MARTIRFHLDENCHPAIAGGLRRRGVDVTTTPEVGLLHASDGNGKGTFVNFGEREGDVRKFRRSLGNGKGTFVNFAVVWVV
jgi:hypothetical protein